MKNTWEIPENSEASMGASFPSPRCHVVFGRGFGVGGIHVIGTAAADGTHGWSAGRRRRGMRWRGDWPMACWSQADHNELLKPNFRVSLSCEAESYHNLEPFAWIWKWQVLGQCGISCNVKSAERNSQSPGYCQLKLAGWSCLHTYTHQIVMIIRWLFSVLVENQG